MVLEMMSRGNHQVRVDREENISNNLTPKVPSVKKLGIREVISKRA